MKKVKFEVAKKLKEYGFPQANSSFDGIYYDDGEFVYMCDTGDYEDTHDVSEWYAVPSYFDAFIWLTKKVTLELLHHSIKDKYFVCLNEYYDFPLYSDAEDAIEEAIDIIFTEQYKNIIEL